MRCVSKDLYVNFWLQVKIEISPPAAAAAQRDNAEVVGLATEIIRDVN